MTWREAEAALETGATMRRREWLPSMCLYQDGERLVLKQVLPDRTKPFKSHPNGRKGANAGRTYSPSMEATKAVDWERVM